MWWWLWGYWWQGVMVVFVMLVGMGFVIVGVLVVGW